MPFQSLGPSLNYSSKLHSRLTLLIFNTDLWLLCLFEWLLSFWSQLLRTGLDLSLRNLPQVTFTLALSFSDNANVLINPGQLHGGKKISNYLNENLDILRKDENTTQNNFINMSLNVGAERLEWIQKGVLCKPSLE